MVTLSLTEPTGINNKVLRQFTTGYMYGFSERGNFLIICRDFF